MLSEIERFVNAVRRRSPNAHTWQDYRCDLKFFRQSVGDCPPGCIVFGYGAVADLVADMVVRAVQA